MRAYYALVDDLISEDEFEELVLSYSDDSEPDHDLHSAAALAAGKMGRLHTKIADIKKGPTLISFYCRIIDRYILPDSEAALNLSCELNPGYESGADSGRYVNTSSESYHSHKREFKGDDRRDVPLSVPYGSSSLPSEYSAEFPSVRLMLLCGDETGEVIVHFRNDMAFAVMDMPAGSVIEVAARYKKSGEVYAADMQLSEHETILREGGQDKIFYDSVTFVVLGLNAGDETHISYAETNGLNDGYFGSELADDLLYPAYFTLFCGDSNKTFTIFFRDYRIPEFLHEGMSFWAGNLMRIPSVNGDLRFTAGKNTKLFPAKESVVFTYTSPSAAEAGNSGSFVCRILSAGRVREFYSKKGEISYVRNLTVADVSSGDEGSDSILALDEGNSGQNLVLWGDNARIPVSEGEIVEIVNGFVKIRDFSLSRDDSCSGYEIHAGINSIVRTVTSGYFSSCREFSFSGVVIETPCGFIIENGDLCYILSGRVQGLSNGISAEVSGSLHGMRIDVLNWRSLVLSENNICENIDFLLSEWDN